MTIPKHFHQKLKELGVTAVYLFGSTAEGLDSPVSDIDLGILMKETASVSEKISTLDLYQKLYDILSTLFALSGRKIDIVFLQRASLELRVNAVRSGRVIYDNNPELRVNFEESMMILFADFLPLKYELDQILLKKI